MISLFERLDIRDWLGVLLGLIPSAPRFDFVLVSPPVLRYQSAILLYGMIWFAPRESGSLTARQIDIRQT